MGQYYRAVILAENKKTVENWVEAYDFFNGAKLMGHSWLPNDFARSFESLILNNPKRVVWAGDYADVCGGRKTNVYDRATDVTKVKPVIKVNLRESRFIINHTKKEFVDKQAVPNKDGWRIHPLPLLTCEGNGRGGGDYNSSNGEEYVGTWARDVISVASKKPKGYKEIKPNFGE